MHACSSFLIFICTSYFGSIVVYFLFILDLCFLCFFLCFFMLLFLCFAGICKITTNNKQTNKKGECSFFFYFFMFYVLCFMLFFMLDAQNCTCCGAIATESGWGSTKILYLFVKENIKTSLNVFKTFGEMRVMRVQLRISID